VVEFFPPHRVVQRIYPTLNIWFFWPRRRGALAENENSTTTDDDSSDPDLGHWILFWNKV
jgi:hypothetical protein